MTLTHVSFQSDSSPASYIPSCYFLKYKSFINYYYVIEWNSSPVQRPCPWWQSSILNFKPFKYLWCCQWTNIINSRTIIARWVVWHARQLWSQLPIKNIIYFKYLCIKVTRFVKRCLVHTISMFTFHHHSMDTAVTNSSWLGAQNSLKWYFSFSPLRGYPPPSIGLLMISIALLEKYLKWWAIQQHT